MEGNAEISRTNKEDKSSDNCQPSWKETSSRLKENILSSVDKDLVVPKLAFLFFFMATGAFLPYLGVFYKQLWLSARQSGILLGVRPFVKMLCSPLWGMVTDTCNRPKLILLVSILGSSVAHFSQSVVSPFRLPCYPEMNGTNFSHLGVGMLREHAGKQSTRRSGFPTATSDFHNKLSLKGKENTNMYNSEVDKATTLQDKGKADQLSHELGKAHIFKSELVHRRESEGVIKQRLVPARSEQVAIHEDKPRQETRGAKNILTRNKKRKQPNLWDDFRVTDNRTIFITLLVIVLLGEFIAAPAPMLTDSGTLGILSGREHEYGRQRLFGSVGWGFGSLLSGAVVTAFNSCPFEDSINYVLCFYVFAVAMILDFFVSLFFKFCPAPPKSDAAGESEFWKGLKIFCNLKNGAFICTLLFLGFSHSLQLSFLFWFLQDIGGTPILFTIIVGVNCLSEVVMFFMATYFVQKIGHDAVIYTGLGCYGLRFLLYSYLHEPWWVLPLEALQGFTYGGVWTASVAYVGPQPGQSVSINRGCSFKGNLVLR